MEAVDRASSLGYRDADVLRAREQAAYERVRVASRRYKDLKALLKDPLQPWNDPDHEQVQRERRRVLSARERAREEWDEARAAYREAYAARIRAEREERRAR